jgi:ribonucleotide reductase alpha subunit
MGIMGFQDALYEMGIAYGSDAAVDFADESMEVISYYAIQTSSDLRLNVVLIQHLKVHCGIKASANRLFRVSC